MFKKGDKVAIIGSWDNCGRMYIRRSTVHSFGKKFAKFIDNNTGEMFGRDFSVEHLNSTCYFNWKGVFADTGTMEDLEAIAIENGTWIRQANIADALQRIERTGDANGYFAKVISRIESREICAFDFKDRDNYLTRD